MVEFSEKGFREKRNETTIRAIARIQEKVGKGEKMHSQTVKHVSKKHIYS